MIKKLFSLAAIGSCVFPMVGSAQSGLPVVNGDIPDQVLETGADQASISLNEIFGLDGVEGDLARFDTDFGIIDVQLLSNDAPLTVQNFLNYVRDGDYDNTIFHRRPEPQEEDGPLFVLQGGGFTSEIPPNSVPTDDPVVNEFKLGNVRGTMAMAKLGGDPDSATSQWFFNLVDNRENLDNQNGGFTVFARVIGSGMTVVDTISELPVGNASSIDPAFTELPIEEFPDDGILTVPLYVTINTVREVGVHPGGGFESSVLTYEATSDNTAAVSAEISDENTLLLASGESTGQANITVTATDPHGNSVSETLAVTVEAAGPVFLSQPLSRAVENGKSVTLRGEVNGEGLTYQWLKDGVEIAGATSASLTIDNFSNADEGSYVLRSMSNGETVDSNPASLEWVGNYANLVNLSTRGVAKSGASAMFVGFVTTPTVGEVPVILRAVGPTLGAEPINLPGALADPSLSLVRNGEEISANDDWFTRSDVNTLISEMNDAGAFGLVDESKDAVLSENLTFNVAGYSAVASAPEGEAGVVLVEAYDRNRGAGPVSLVNLSTRGEVGIGGDIMIAGLVLEGIEPVNLIIRGLGPRLDEFLTGALEDPKIVIFDESQQIIAENDDWQDNEYWSTLSALSDSVGAIAIEEGSKDASIHLTLNPGIYSVHLSGVAGGTGIGLIEVYLAP